MLKKLIACFLCILFAFGLAACGAEPAQTPPAPTADTPAQGGEDVSGVSGVYMGKAKGYGGELTVELTLENSAIKAVNVVEHNETAGIGTIAIDTIPKKIVEAQSLAVDAVSSCTLASDAIVEATKNALIAAGLNPDDYMSKGGKAATGESKSLKTGVLIVGAGGAGVTAAIYAKEAGADVLVLEKMPVIGVASAISSGATNSCGSEFAKNYGITNDSPEVLMQDLKKAGHDYNQQDVMELFAHNAGKAFDWLVSLGVEYTDPAGGEEHTANRTFLSTGGGVAVMKAIENRATEAGVEIMLNTRATEIIVEGGNVVGVKAENTDGTVYDIRADVTVMATGGYGANHDILTEYLKNVPYYGHASSTGDGHLMADKIGAQLLHMEFGKVYPGGWEYAPNLAKIQLGHTTSAIRSTSAIIVNTSGERVFREGGLNHEFREAIMSDPQYMLYLLLDQESFEFWKESVTKSMITEETLEAAIKENGASVPVVINGATLDDVAKTAGMDPATLKATVERWNGFVRNGKDEDFNRADLVREIGEGPYYLVAQKTRFATTMGGLKINDKFEVYDKNDQIIPGMLAIGELAYGVHGDDTITGSALTWAIASGQLCGPIAAEMAK